MPVSDKYINYVQDLLQDFAPLRVKRMFGGAGVYSGNLFFAIIADDELYLKVDHQNRTDYEAQGLQPFTYMMKGGKTATMSYYPLPADVLEDTDGLRDWVRKALAAAHRAKHKTS
ncbi:MAG: TfoX/Sxy family protein [Gammaproteobacteria bacterium]